MKYTMYDVCTHECTYMNVRVVRILDEHIVFWHASEGQVLLWYTY